MSTHNVCFYGEITKIISKISSNTFLICSAADLRQGCPSVAFSQNSANRISKNATSNLQISREILNLKTIT